MEELGKPNKIEIYQDMRVDKKVHDLKQDATLGLTDEPEQPPIESQVYLTSQEKCLAIPVCCQCADMRICLTSAGVDQSCYAYCLSNPSEASPTSFQAFLEKQK